MKRSHLLTAGAADSGKSTIIKQMRILHDGGFGEVERRKWKDIIFRNLVDSFLYLLDVTESQQTDLEDAENIVR
jgi:hypothetical protein